MRLFGATVLLVGLCAPLSLHAQYWAKDLGGTGGDRITDVKVGPDGFIYAVGEFSAAMVVDGTTYTSSGGTDVFVVKMDDAGSVVWLVQAGGSAIDRSGKVAIDGAGHLVVTGQFLGAADLFGSAFTSVANSTDFFLAQLSMADGSSQWVRTGGGAAFGDLASGVAIAPNGTVVAVGEFQGTSDFDGTSLTSMLDPNTLLPSVDVFVAAYTTTGTPLWLKHGQAEFTDRALDVVADANNNFYVGGQFSDTIQFDQVHNNAMSSAIFLLKLDAAGNEQWFRRCGGGTLNQLRDMQVTSGSQLLVAGDLQGDMLYMDPVPQTVAAADDYNYFLLRVDAGGTLLSDTAVGSQNPVALRAVDQRADTVAVFGEFECQFTGLSQFYNGTGLFMATGPQDLFVAKHRFSNWQVLQAQQFGGKEDKSAAGIASLPNGDVVFGGGYEDRLHIPSDASAWGDRPYQFWCDHAFTTGLDFSGYCQDGDYTKYSTLIASGLSEGFIGRALVTSRQPYDFWIRYDSIQCQRPSLDLCVRPFNGWLSPDCVDSVSVCGTLSLAVLSQCADANDPISFQECQSCMGIGGGDDIGPELSFLWSDGTTALMTSAPVTGWYWCTVSTANGCWSWTDSIHVTVDPPPPVPLVSDELGQYVDQGNWLTLSICDTVDVWFSNLPPGATALWTTPDTVLTDTAAIAGTSILTFTSQEGCTSFTILVVDLLPTPPVPAFDSASFEWYVTDGADMLLTDTVYVCEGQCAQGVIVPTWYQGGGPVQLDSAAVADWYSICAEGHDPPWLSAIGWSLAPPVSGWYTFGTYGSFNNAPCGFDVAPFYFSDSVYAVVVANPVQGIVGPTLLCPGDSIELTSGCISCDSLVWTYWFTDTIGVNVNSVFLDQVGPVDLDSWNTVGTATCYYNSSHWVDIVPGPSLDILPGAICSGDSALLWTTAQGTSYQWLGPNGPIPFNNDSLWVSDFGDYFITVIDTGGCEITNGPIELAEFASPFLDVQPDYVLCPGDSITITVITNDTASISWSAPFSGSDSIQTVTQPGLYSVTVGACAVLTLTANIVGGSANATILPNDTMVLCAGDSVQLTGANGAAVYIWDSILLQQSIWVSNPGSYQLMVIDDVGCTDTAVAVVGIATVSDPLLVQGDTVCQGSDAVLTATGSGQISWFSDPGLTNVIGMGTSITIPAVQQSTTVYVLQEDSACTASPVEVQVLVIAAPTGAGIVGPGQVCVGDSLVLDMTGGPYTSVVWQTPNGTVTGDPLVVYPVQADVAGTYVATPSAAPCTWGSYSWDVSVVNAQPLDIGADTSLCEGLAYTVALPNGFSNGQWSNGASGNSSVFLVPALCWVLASDVNGCTVSDTLFIEGLTCGLEVPNVFSPNGDGSNDGWLVTADGFVAAQAVIHNRWGQELYSGDPRVRPWNGRHQTTNEPVPDGVYYFVLKLDRGDGSELVRTGYLHLTR
ncbi:MAG: gliding motility-associated C-terminal domain-containing protein [Flavobacteriales bacterium]|nr:MAG: gliding motility-associated C-terminal domain-containing protein [Flavobacteriales bacterium]